MSVQQQLDAASFNSTLVRLKVCCGLHCAGCCEGVFQFHTGSIKRLLYTLLKSQRLAFQFHTGSIKSLSKLKRANNERHRVSIPHWFD